MYTSNMVAFTIVDRMVTVIPCMKPQWGSEQSSSCQIVAINLNTKDGLSRHVQRAQDGTVIFTQWVT